MAMTRGQKVMAAGISVAMLSFGGAMYTAGQAGGYHRALREVEQVENVASQLQGLRQHPEIGENVREAYTSLNTHAENLRKSPEIKRLQSQYDFYNPLAYWTTVGTLCSLVGGILGGAFCTKGGGRI